MSKFEEYSKNVDRYQELVGYAIPGVFSAVAASCQTQIEGLLALAVMTAMVSLTPELRFLRNYRARSQQGENKNYEEEDERGLVKHIGMSPVPTLIVFGWLLLIGFGVIR